MIESLDPALRAELVATYEEVMWLAKRPNVAASAARAWYTHVVAGRLVRRLRQFTGKVSRKAAESGPGDQLRLEHFKRMQTTLTALVGRHRTFKKPDPDDFIRTLIDCERVHIVTFAENYDAVRADGDYDKAGIKLLNWSKLTPESQAFLWKRMLRGRVANAAEFKPIIKGATGNKSN